MSAVRHGIGAESTGNFHSGFRQHEAAAAVQLKSENLFEPANSATLRRSFEKVNDIGCVHKPPERCVGDALIQEVRQLASELNGIAPLCPRDFMSDA